MFWKSARLIRFRLIHLMVATGVFCAVNAFMATELHRTRRAWQDEQAALKLLPEPHHGYGVSREYPVYFPIVRPWFPTEYYNRVSDFSYEYDIRDHDIDQQMAALAQFTELSSLVFREPIASDRNLHLLASLRRLETLKLSGCKISDDSISIVSEFPKLRELDVTDTMISDGGVRRIVELAPRLNVLNLGGIRLSADTVAAISQMKELAELDLSETDTPLEHLELLRDSPSLKDLYLYQTPYQEDDLLRLDSILNAAIIR